MFANYLLRFFSKVLLISAIVFSFFCQQAAAADKILNIQYWLTPNGVRVYYVATPQLPILDILVGFDAGSARDGAQFGLANLTNNMLEEGTAKLNADKLAEQFEKLGALFDTTVDRDMAVVTLRTVTNPTALKPALDTLTDLLANPAFSPQSLQRRAQQALNSIAQQQQSLNNLADNAFYSALYKDMPYAHPILGTQESVLKLNATQLQDFYKKYYVTKNAFILLVGAVDIAQAKNIATQLSQALKVGEAAPPLPKSTVANTAATIHTHFQSMQTHIEMGQTGITRFDPDYFPLVVGNYILGGNSLVSILNDEVREKRGLTYGIYSSFVPMSVPGPYMINIETPIKTADQALSLVHEVLRHYIQNGPTETQLSLAKQNLIGGFALRFDSNKSILDNLQIMAFYRLPLDYLDTYKSKVNAVTTAQIRDAFQRRIHPDKMITVTVGQRPVSNVSSTKQN